MSKKKESPGLESTTAVARQKEIALSIPLGQAELTGYQRELTDEGEVLFESRGIHLNVQLGQKAAAAFSAFRNGLRAAGEKLPDGRPVYSNADALRWLCESIASAAG